MRYTQSEMIPMEELNIHKALHYWSSSRQLERHGKRLQRQDFIDMRTRQDRHRRRAAATASARSSPTRPSACCEYLLADEVATRQGGASRTSTA